VDVLVSVYPKLLEEADAEATGILF